MFLNSPCGFAQSEENTWAFGTHAALDFSSGTPVALTGFQTSSNEGAAAVSDIAGNLLFYSDGSNVWNRHHAVMPNGAGLLTVNYSSSTSGALICQVPGSDSLYYLFTVDESSAAVGYLRYNIIDMSLDGGDGDIVTGYKDIVLDNFVNEKITITKDALCGFWLIAYSNATNQYRSFHITSTGIAPEVVSTSPYPNFSLGQLVVTPDATRIANAAFDHDFVELASFDINTGLVTDFMLINIPATAFGASAYGCAFSPNSQVMYVAEYKNIYQFDVSSGVEATIEATMYDLGVMVSFPQLRLANNGKIYFPSYPDQLNVIQDPDLLGVACDVDMAVLTFPSGSTLVNGLGTPVGYQSLSASFTIGRVSDTAVCSIDELVLHAGSDTAETYHWDDGSNTAIRPVTSSGTYWVRYGSACSFTIDTFYVTFQRDSIALLNEDTALCAGTTLPIGVVGSTGFAYYWTPEPGIGDPHATHTFITPPESGWITITAAKEGCGEMKDSFYIDLQPVPLVNAGRDDTICGGVPYPLYGSVSPAGYDGYIFEWFPVDFLNDPHIQDPVFLSYSSSQEIILSVSTPLGCSGRDTMLLTVVPEKEVLTNVSDTGICAPGAIQLEATNAQYYQWIPGDGLSASDIPDPVASPDVSTMYMVIGEYRGCRDTQWVNVEVYPNVVLSVPDSVNLYPGEKYTMDVSSNASYFQWYPPEGLSDTGIANPDATPQVRTRYFLTATSEYGCVANDSIDIIIDLNHVIDIPNAFVPGASFSENGILKILKRGDVSLDKFEIYDRWGIKVFETSDMDKGWDGTYQHRPQPMGVYVYYILGSLPAGQKVQLQGNVTLIR